MRWSSKARSSSEHQTLHISAGPYCARRFTGGLTELEVEANNLGRLILELDQRFPGLGHQIDERSGLGRPGDAPQQVDLAIERHHQAVNPLAPKHRAELRALYRQLADRSVEVDVGDLPGSPILAH